MDGQVPLSELPLQMAYGCGAREMLGRAPLSSFCTESWGLHGPPVPHKMTKLWFCIGDSSRFQENSSELQVSLDCLLEQQGAIRINSLRFCLKPKTSLF
jgi:hypothetical protein